MKFKLKRPPYVLNNTLRVEVEHEYGEENIGLGLRAKKTDPKTGKPRYLSEVSELLDRKYGNVLEDERASAYQEEEVKSDYVGVELDTDDIKKDKVPEHIIKSMKSQDTKEDLEVWARNRGVELDRRQTRENMEKEFLRKY